MSISQVKAEREYFLKMTILILTSFSFQLLEIVGLFWLSIWGSQSASSSSRGNTLVTEGFSQESQIFFLNILAVIYFIGLVFTVFALIIRVSHRLGASLNLYMNLLRSILNAPMSFFDSTPRGKHSSIKFNFLLTYNLLLLIFM